MITVYKMSLSELQGSLRHWCQSSPLGLLSHLEPQHLLRSIRDEDGLHALRQCHDPSILGMRYMRHADKGANHVLGTRRHH
jgi:hypothetical protein